MQIFKTLFLVLLYFCLFSANNYAQTTTLNEFSITAQSESSSIPTVRIALRGSNVEINGFYNSPEAFRICAPCTRNDNLQFSRNFLAINAQPVSGTVNGVNYEQLYLGFGFNLEQQRAVQIPPIWSRKIKIVTPVKLTGRIGAWRNSNEIGQIDRAVFYQENINLTGRVNLSLNWRYAEELNRRLYFDNLLIYEFRSTVEN